MRPVVFEKLDLNTDREPRNGDALWNPWKSKLQAQRVEVARALDRGFAFVSIARLQFQPPVRARREFFLSTDLLSDQPMPL
jgi:hypothetical protein